MVIGLCSRELGCQPCQAGLNGSRLEILGGGVWRLGIWALDVRFQHYLVDVIRLGRIIAPVIPFAEPKVAKAAGLVAGLGVNERPGQFGDYVAPGDYNLLPVGRVDRKAISVAQGEIALVDQLDAAPVLRAVSLDPETEAVGTVPVGRGRHRSDHEAAAGPLDKTDFCRLADLADHRLDLAGRVLDPFAVGKLAGLEPEILHVEQHAGRILREATCRKGQQEHDTGYRQVAAFAYRTVHGEFSGTKEG